MSGCTSEDYARELTLEAPVERVFDAVATLEGLRGWWTARASGSAAKGGTIRLEFEGMDEHIDMRVLAAERPTEVAWSLLEHTSLEEWTGTTVRFALTPRGKNACRLTFCHQGLSPKLACYEDCEAGWEHFLDSLVSLVETGKGSPFGSGQGRS